MPDSKIPALPYATNGEEIQRDDVILISRNGSGAKARINGNLVLPNFTSADAGKIFVVSSTGVLELQDRAPVSWALHKTQALGNQQAGSTFSQTLTGFDMTDYSDLVCNFQFSGGDILTARVAPMRDVVQVADGWKVWWSADDALSWVRPTGSDPAATLHVYGRVG